MSDVTVNLEGFGFYVMRDWGAVDLVLSTDPYKKTVKENLASVPAQMLKSVKPFAIADSWVARFSETIALTVPEQDG